LNKNIIDNESEIVFEKVKSPTNEINVEIKSTQNYNNFFGLKLSDLSDNNSLPIHDSTNEKNVKSERQNILSPERRKKKNKLVFKNNIIKNLGIKNVNALSLKLNNQNPDNNQIVDSDK